MNAPAPIPVFTDLQPGALELEAAALEILNASNATSQQPIAFDLVRARLQKELGGPVDLDDLRRALDALHQRRSLNTCKIISGGIETDVYWPTGMKALAGNFNNRRVQTAAPAPKPKEEPPMRATKTARLIMAIEKNGPISRTALALQSKIQAGHIEAHLKAAIGAGTIVARQMYSTEHGKDLPHYMTKEQAELIAKPEPTKPMSEAEANKLADESISEIVDELEHDRATLLNLIGAESVEQAAEILTKAKQTEHTLRNDAAGANMILSNVARLLAVSDVSDIPGALNTLRNNFGNSETTIRNIASQLSVTNRYEIPGAINDLRSEIGRLQLLAIGHSETAPTAHAAADLAPAPSAALVLIAANGIAHLDDLKDITDPSARAVQAVEDGEACRAILVHIVGEARRTVEWRTAA